MPRWHPQVPRRAGLTYRRDPAPPARWVSGPSLLSSFASEPAGFTVNGPAQRGMVPLGSVRSLGFFRTPPLFLRLLRKPRPGGTECSRPRSDRPWPRDHPPYVPSSFPKGCSAILPMRSPGAPSERATRRPWFFLSPGSTEGWVNRGLGQPRAGSTELARPLYLPRRVTTLPRRRTTPPKSSSTV